VSRTGFLFFLTASSTVIFLSSCSTARKERLEQRDKIAGTSGLYCDFINGEKFNDVEVVLNLEMGKRCDSTKPFSISGYKSTAEVVGMMYCCSTTKKAEGAAGSGASTSGASGSGGASKAGSTSSSSTSQAGKPAAGSPAASTVGGSKAPSASNPAKDPLIDEVTPE
jgi:hypothetical protein